MNKGQGVARTIPVFCIEDYIVYYFCIKVIIPADGIQGFQNIVDTHSSTTWTGRWPDRGQFAA